MDRRVGWGSQPGYPYAQAQASQSRNSYLPSCSRGPISWLNSSSIVASQYFSPTRRLDKYLERYLTRYGDIYVRQGHDADATAVSKNAIHELAGRLGPSSGLHKTKSLTKAKLMILCEIYSQCDMPQSITALVKLVTWTEVIDKRLQITIIFEQSLADQAESAAEKLWQAYRASVRERVAIRDPRSQYEVLELENLSWIPQSQPYRHPPPGLSTMEHRVDAIGLTNSILPRHFQMQGSLTVLERMQHDSDYRAVHRYGDQGMPPFPPDMKHETPNASPKKTGLSTLDEMREASPIQTSDIRVMSSPVLPPFVHLSQREGQRFNRTVLVFSANREYVPVAALFDTGCEGENCVSYELLTELGMDDKIGKFQTSPSLDASGQDVCYKGTIELRWQHYDEHNIHKNKKIRRDDFNVLASNHIQIIFGQPYCREHNLIQFNTHVLTPLIPNERISSEMQNQIMTNKKRRDEKKNQADKERIKIESIHDGSSILSKVSDSCEHRSPAPGESASIQRRHA